MTITANARRVVRASAPGKVILVGEHAAVYGRPAIVAALGLRVEVELEVDSDRGAATVDLDLRDFGVRDRFEWPQVEVYAGAARDRAALPAMGHRRSHVALVALGEAQLAVARRLQTAPPRRSIVLRIASELPVGGGCGSSAAVGAAVIAAFFAAFDLDAGPDFERTALEVERRQHGSPSGVDTAAVLRGGVLWTLRDAESRLRITHLGDPARIIERFEMYDSGVPAQSTGEVVAAVASLGQSQPSVHGNALDLLEAATRDFKSAIEDGEHARVPGCVRRAEQGLESLGVVPEPVRRVIRKIEKAGGAAKVSGAGVLGGAGAGSVLVLDPGGDSGRIASGAGWRRLDGELGVVGLTVDGRGFTSS